jgi:hypothetical protein
MPVNVVAVRGLASNFRVHTNLQALHGAGRSAEECPCTLPIHRSTCRCSSGVPALLLTRAGIACLLASQV